MSTPVCPVFIGGEWRHPTGLPATPVFNPSQGEVIAECPVGNAALAKLGEVAADSS